MPRVCKKEQEAMKQLLETISALASLKGAMPWVWLDGMPTERVWQMYDGNASQKSVTTRLIRAIGRDYIDTEIKRVNGKIQRVYYAKKIT
nr:MAG TPA: hypothetical protein [Caudoviricetes sp.]